MFAKYAFATFLAGITFAGTALAQDQNKADRSQARLEKEVRHEIVTQPFLGVFDDISFRTEGNTVTLSGQVTRRNLKAKIEQAVKEVEGVVSVDNQIEVLPQSVYDDRLRIALYQTIYGNTTLQRYTLQWNLPIRIIVKNGHATLEGVVGREADKSLAGIRANGVPGLYSLTNNLRVEKLS